MSWDGRYYQGIPNNYPQFPIPNGTLNRPDVSNNTSTCSINELKSNKPHNELDADAFDENNNEIDVNDISGHGGRRRQGTPAVIRIPTPKTRQQKEINIGGENIWVDKKAAGAVPMRFDTGIISTNSANNEVDGLGAALGSSSNFNRRRVSNIEVLMLSRGGTGDAQDPWSVPKGGIRASDKSLQEGSIRVAKEKAAVLDSEIIENLGWLLRKKKNKNIGVHTLVLRVKRTGRLPDGSNVDERRMRWIPIKEAIDGAKESGNDFTQEALKRGNIAIASYRRRKLPPRPQSCLPSSRCPALRCRSATCKAIPPGDLKLKNRHRFFRRMQVVVLIRAIVTLKRK